MSTRRNFIKSLCLSIATATTVILCPNVAKPKIEKESAIFAFTVEFGVKHSNYGEDHYVDNKIYYPVGEEKIQCRVIENYDSKVKTVTFKEGVCLINYKF